tara:strand:- start:363 stop:527 length:165 start_codon:yes stop_codon:yes gene_type:complete
METTGDIIMFILGCGIAIIGLPLLFIVINDSMGDWPESKLFDKSDLEYKDGDNT